jgi:predicted GNAT family acetyltransferase
VFEEIEKMGIKAAPVCPFLARVAKSDPRWKKLFKI